MRDPQEIIYSLNIEDIQTVATEELERELSDEELNLVIDELPGFIDWHGAISFTIGHALRELREAQR
jgi:hypothetical protein